MNMNVWTWNVNSVRTKIPKVNELLAKYDIDVLVLTETKIKSEHEETVSKQINGNYVCLWNSNKLTYHHGIAIIYKKSLNISVLCSWLDRAITITDTNLCNMKNKTKILTGLNDTNRLIEDIKKAHQVEGRIITIKINNPNQSNNGNDIVIVGTYVPNSGVNRGDTLRRLAYRTLVWDKDMYEYLVKLTKEYKNVIWIGDLNVARKDNDMNRNAPTCAGTTPEERANFENFIGCTGWVDTWDHANPTVIDYHLRWTYGVEKGRKLRLDYVMCSPSLKNCIKSSLIDQEFDGSDHVPMGTQFVL